jgi:uroporphyrinogen-III synthase
MYPVPHHPGRAATGLGSDLDTAIAAMDQYDWIVFTSVNGVDYFFRRLFEKGLDVRALGHIKTAAIGPATADRLRTWGLKSDIIPQSYRAESVVEAFAATGEGLQDSSAQSQRSTQRASRGIDPHGGLGG